MDMTLWLVFLGTILVLWTSGVALFARSALTPRRKIVWTLFLLMAGAAIGIILPLDGIRDRFFILLLLLPALALIDIKLARSNRTFLFWFRACSFEICTVFAAAALTRIVLFGL